jgi:NAD-dependent deacetylase
LLFGGLLRVGAVERAQALCAGADVLLCIGTSLEVHPVAGLPELTHAAGGDVVLMTMGPTPWDDRATCKLDGEIEEELEALVAAI